jgi:PD-(D/E)XK nuclease superfamily
VNPRPKPYTWVTWITGFLANTEQCRYKPWVKSRYFIEKGVPGETVEQKRDSQLRMSQWTQAHDAMTGRRVALLRQQGYTVRVEDENAFKLEGKFVTLAGKADIIAMKEAEKKAVVIDEKSGKEKAEHYWQVLVYIFAFGVLKDVKRKLLDGTEVDHHLKNYALDGELEYRDENIQAIPGSDLTTGAKQKILDVMTWIGSPSEPPTSPSASECRFCDILHCKDRIQPDHQAANVQKYF